MINKTKERNKDFDADLEIGLKNSLLLDRESIFKVIKMIIDEIETLKENSPDHFVKISPIHFIKKGNDKKRYDEDLKLVLFMGSGYFNQKVTDLEQLKELVNNVNEDEFKNDNNGKKR